MAFVLAWPLAVVVVYASRFLALHRRRFPIPYLSPILSVSYLVSSEPNSLLVSHSSAQGTVRGSMMPSLALGGGRLSSPFVDPLFPPARSMVG